MHVSNPKAKLGISIDGKTVEPSEASGDKYGASHKITAKAGSRFSAWIDREEDLGEGHRVGVMASVDSRRLHQWPVMLDPSQKRLDIVDDLVVPAHGESVMVHVRCLDVFGELNEAGGDRDKIPQPFTRFHVRITGA
jgi:hypothetical protein